jgi:hypothetical protein
MQKIEQCDVSLKSEDLMDNSKDFQMQLENIESSVLNSNYFV